MESGLQKKRKRNSIHRRSKKALKGELMKSGLQKKRKRNSVHRRSKKALKGELMESGLQKKRKRNSVHRRSKKAPKGELMESGLQKKQKIEEDEDRISQLPEEILHRIQYLLPTKTAGRTSILSKSWQHAWSSFTDNLEDFDDEMEQIYKDDHVEDLNSFKEKRREIKRKLTLFINFIEKSLQNKTSIEKLRLRLTFPDGKTEEKCLEKLGTFATDRNVKELTLDVCTLSYCSRNYRDNTVKVRHKRCWLPLQVFCDSKTITVLKLFGFELPYTYKFKFSQNLKQLTLRECALHEVIIDAPNLVSLECIVNRLPYFSFKSIANLKEVELECRLGSDFISWSNNLTGFVRKFNNPTGLNLVIRFDEGNDIVLERLSEIMVCSLLNLKELEPKIILSSTNSLSLVKRLLHGRQLKALSIVSSSSSNLVQILNEKILNREVEPRCCNDSSTECWRNTLDDAKIEDLDKAEDFENSNWISLLKSYQVMQYQTTTFGFKWIPQ